MFLIEDTVILGFLFFLTAFFYSLAGLGGGSTYISLLAISHIPYVTAPAIALMCNITAVSGGAYHFIKNKQVSFRFIFPFLLLSVPLAYIGGNVAIKQQTYRLLLGSCFACICNANALFYDIKRYRQQDEKALNLIFHRPYS